MAMTDKEDEEFRETLNRLTPAECAVILSCMTGEGFDEALARLEKDKEGSDN